MPKRYKVVWGGEEMIVVSPGRYAGSRGHKIFGRLDCPSGELKMHKNNRVFFRDWEDAIGAGYRPCRICRPDELRLGELVSSCHPAMSRLHVAIWKTGPKPFPDKPSVCFYVALAWEKSCGKETTSFQVNLETWFPYPTAIAKAVAWGKKLGLPVIEHRVADERALYLPEPGSLTLAQWRERQRLLKSSKVQEFTYTPFA